jgi:hypothetical protein
VTLATATTTRARTAAPAWACDHRTENRRVPRTGPTTEDSAVSWRSHAPRYRLARTKARRPDSPPSYRTYRAGESLPRFGGPLAGPTPRTRSHVSRSQPARRLPSIGAGPVMSWHPVSTMTPSPSRRGTVCWVVTTAVLQYDCPSSNLAAQRRAGLVDLPLLDTKRVADSSNWPPFHRRRGHHRCVIGPMRSRAVPTLVVAHSARVDGLPVAATIARKRPPTVPVGV